MAKVPLPDRGQPLDVTYLYQIANALNDAVDTISTATYNYTTIDTSVSGTGIRKDVKNSNAKIYATQVLVTSSDNVSSGATKNFSVSFASNFGNPPVVTATPVNEGGSPIGNDVFVVINSVTASGLDFTIRFNSSGQVGKLYVNILAIGLPG